MTMVLQPEGEFVTNVDYLSGTFLYFGFCSVKNNTTGNAFFLQNKIFASILYSVASGYH
jgi:hypothetical protein